MTVTVNVLTERHKNLKTLSGIETSSFVPFVQQRAFQGTKTSKPYQGLKHFPFNVNVRIFSLGTKTSKPYQGFKQIRKISAPSAGEACRIFAGSEIKFCHFGRILAAPDKNPAEN